MGFDVVIVGAGPAGLFAAYQISKHSKLKTAVIDLGHDVKKRVCHAVTYKGCTKCSPCNILHGVGGAGTLSSGLLNLRPDIGGNLGVILKSDEAAWNLVNYVDRIFLEYGAPKKLYSAHSEGVEELERKAASVGIKFIPIPQRHIGTDRAPKVIQRLKEDLERRGVNFILSKKVLRVDKGQATLDDGMVVKGKYLIVAPGRSGCQWFADEAHRLKIPTRHEPVDIGVRVEVPAVVMDPVIRVSRDPKFHVTTDTYDDFVRTFCVNHQGFVVQEVYDSFVGVNGHALSNKKSPNTNFALLVKIELTEPLEDTTAYGRTIAMQATTLGGGKPLIQRLGDLRNGRRSTWKRIDKDSIMKPTLESVTPGDISMALPHRLVADLLEALNKLDRVIPGVAAPSTFIYAPEVKYSANRVYTNHDLETPIENLFAAGDGAGLSSGLVPAAATGILAAEGVLKKEGIQVPTRS